MVHFDPTNSECLVFTYKEGLLSAVAHDLKIRATRYTIDGSQAKGVTADFDASALGVISAEGATAKNPDILSSKDKREIEKNIREEVFNLKHHPRIRFTGSYPEKTSQGYRLSGTLSLNGIDRIIELQFEPQGTNLVAEVVIDQRDYGLKPFSAMFGTLKIKPEIKVQIRISRELK